MLVKEKKVRLFTKKEKGKPERWKRGQKTCQREKNVKTIKNRKIIVKSNKLIKKQKMCSLACKMKKIKEKRPEKRKTGEKMKKRMSHGLCLLLMKIKRKMLKI